MSKRLHHISPGQTIWYNCKRATVLRQFTVGEFNNHRTDLRMPSGTVVTTTDMDPRVYAETLADIRRRSRLLNQALHGS